MEELNRQLLEYYPTHKLIYEFFHNENHVEVSEDTKKIVANATYIFSNPNKDNMLMTIMKLDLQENKHYNPYTIRCTAIPRKV